MAERSRGMLFRKRNVLGAALVAGIGLGVYLGQFKGFGLGGGSWVGLGSNGDSTVKVESPGASTDSTNTLDATPVSNVVKVLIDEREFLLRETGGDVPIELSKLIKLIEKAPGDADGFKVRIYEKASARVSAEEKLKEALATAEIPDSAVLWVPTAVKDIDKR